MKSIELEAGKMELVQAIVGINNPEVLTKARKALYRILHSTRNEEDEDQMPGGIPALQFTSEQLESHVDKSLKDIAEGRVHTSEEAHRVMENKFPFLCK